MTGKAGAEILAPLAIVVLGGLVSSTALNLVVVPAAYAWVFGHGDRPHGSALDDDSPALPAPAATTETAPEPPKENS
jgi:hypothetical protein